MEERESKLPAPLGMYRDQTIEKERLITTKKKKRELQGNLSFVMKTSQSLKVSSRDLPNTFQIKVDQILA